VIRNRFVCSSTLGFRLNRRSWCGGRCHAFRSDCIGCDGCLSRCGRSLRCRFDNSGCCFRWGDRNIGNNRSICDYGLGGICRSINGWLSRNRFRRGNDCFRSRQRFNLRQRRSLSRRFRFARFLGSALTF
jgi:hypothetical protein